MGETLTLIFTNSKTAWYFVTKISPLLQQRKIWILTKFEWCSSKIGSAPLEVFYIFGGKSKYWAPMTLIICTRRALLRLTTGKNLVLISPTTFEKSNSSQNRYKNDVQKLFLYLFRDELKWWNLQFGSKLLVNKWRVHNHVPFNITSKRKEESRLSQINLTYTIPIK